MALANKYYRDGRCRKSCVSSRDCRKNKQCICDGECGMSCVNPNGQCQNEPPVIEHIITYSVFSVSSRSERMLIPAAPYIYGSFVEYACEEGYRPEGPAPRCNGRNKWSGELPTCVDTVCRQSAPVVAHARSVRLSRKVNGKWILLQHGIEPQVNDEIAYTCEDGLMLIGDPPKCGEDLRWTSHSAKCAIPCFKKRDLGIIRNLGLTCGPECFSTSDCSNGTICKCDGPCQRVCVNPNADCGEAPSVSRANVTYFGSGVNMTARYQCNEGFYLDSGSLSMQCSGSGIWLGTLPVCEPVRCGDPGYSIRTTQGSIRSGEGNEEYGAIVEFYCPSDYKMLGSPVRQCMGDGQWSGELTVCDLRDGNEERCPHPGVPINGQLIGVDLSVGATVRFQYDENYVMYGYAVQTCLWFREWSGSTTPKCVDPRYPHSASKVIRTLTRSLSNLPDIELNFGRSINSNDINEKHEIYFVFDISQSVLEKMSDLHDEMHFAKRIVRRMENYQGHIRYSITLFASSNLTVLDIADESTTSDSVLKKLDEVYLKAGTNKYGNITRYGTATAHALEVIEKSISFMRLNEPDNKRHVFIFTDGKHTEGKDPEKVRMDISVAFPETEFYSITACDECHTSEKVHDELKALSSGEDGENYIFIEDFYQLSAYLDKVTNVTMDFSKCGQAGDIGSIKAHLSFGRVFNGEDAAAQNAWPWQALITVKSTSMERSLGKRFLRGGGSIINERWILTAAHVFRSVDKLPGWLKFFAVFVGIVDRPLRSQKVKNSVEAYGIESYFPHPDYDSETTNNDIALLKLGSQLYKNMTKMVDKEAGLTYGYYIRPVCLPCTGTLNKENLVDDDQRPLINDKMSFEEKCRQEEKSLLSRNSPAVVTGFGHINQTNSPRYALNPAKRLQQALLKIVDESECQAGIDDIKDLIKNFRYAYTENMICLSGNNETADACNGDSGGPLVRRVKYYTGEREQRTKKNSWVQIGIVSFGYGCGREPAIPGYYTKVARYIRWINETTNGMLPGY